MWLEFPRDITINANSLQCGDQEVSYDKIKSIRVYVKQTTTNLTAWTGIPTVSDLRSEIGLLLIDGNRIDIRVIAYEEWGPFKNKTGMKSFQDGLAFSTFLEEKTFKQRMDHYLKTGTHDMHFKYRTWDFLKDKTIRSNIRSVGKIYASFNPNEYSVKRSFRKLHFKKTGVAGVVDWLISDHEKDEIAINLTYDEDVILYLINKLIGGVS